VKICLELKATHYCSGPAARDYLDIEAFKTHDIEVLFFNYGPFPDYPQTQAKTDIHVTILDLLFNLGPSAKNYLGQSSFIEENSG